MSGVCKYIIGKFRLTIYFVDKITNLKITKLAFIKISDMYGTFRRKKAANPITL
jgi:hypothetical protein